MSHICFIVLEIHTNFHRIHSRGELQSDDTVSILIIWSTFNDSKKSEKKCINKFQSYHSIEMASLVKIVPASTLICIDT